MVVYESKSDDVTRVCNRFVQLNEWSSKGIVRPSDAYPTKKPRTFLGVCQKGYAAKEWWGECLSKTRYLGDVCWDAFWFWQTEGRCINEVDSYDAYHLSCSSQGSLSGEAICQPSVLPLERNQCECGWFDWNFIVACGSIDCNGHACVLDSSSGKRYCDYNTDNNW